VDEGEGSGARVRVHFLDANQGARKFGWAPVRGREADLIGVVFDAKSHYNFCYKPVFLRRPAPGLLCRGALRLEPIGMLRG
jgi:hypothetical protein